MVLKGAAVMSTFAALKATAADLPHAPKAETITHLKEVPKDSGATLTVERRGTTALFGINRPDVQNRIDPQTFRALARGYYDYANDPSLRAAVLFGHGADFSRGIDVDAFKEIAASGKPFVSGSDVIDPLGKKLGLTKPLIVVVHGDTWNMAHELHLFADIRIAAADTRFGQDENTHGRFPGGGATVRFVREAGWGNAMRYMLTGDHWGASEAFRMGTIQEICATSDAALARGINMAEKIGRCGPLGIKATLASAHLAIDPGETLALSKIDAQFGALFHSRDFQEGHDADLTGRQPVFIGK